MNGGWDELTSF